MNCEKAQRAWRHFTEESDLFSIEPYGNGHINDTFLCILRLADGTVEKRILQKMNGKVFAHPEELMKNIVNVTEHLCKKIVENGGDPLRETLNVIPTLTGEPYFVDEEGAYWRAYRFITGAVCYEQTGDPKLFEESGYSFGYFQRMLADYPADTLYETIQGFHDTRARFRKFLEVVSEDACNRASSVSEEIAFVLEHENMVNEMGKIIDGREIPLRVTHNDTKLNNILMDEKSGQGICVIDLDTVMPGLAINDFGDSIRFGASTAAEDEKDLKKVSCDMTLFAAFTRGFLKGCGGSLTEREIELLPLGAKMMTFECGMRFLTDYLQGDIYFKTSRKEHNLDRCRTQFKLVKDMEMKWEMMNSIISKYRIG